MGAEAEGGGGGGGAEQQIHLLEGTIEVPADQRAHLLGLAVVGIHIAGRKGIGADQDAALHLIAEALGTAAGGHHRQVVGATSLG